jgi:hypothetical protein
MPGIGGASFDTQYIANRKSLYLFIVFISSLRPKIMSVHGQMAQFSTFPRYLCQKWLQESLILLPNNI